MGETLALTHKKTHAAGAKTEKPAGRVGDYASLRPGAPAEEPCWLLTPDGPSYTAGLLTGYPVTTAGYRWIIIGPLPGYYRVIVWLP